MQPTLTIRPGLPVRVVVNRDLVLEPYRMRERERDEIEPSVRDYPAFAFSPAASMPATAQISSLSDVSPLTPTAPSRPLSPSISTPPGTGTRRPCASAFTAPTK